MLVAHNLFRFISYLVSFTKRWTNSSKIVRCTKTLEVHRQISPWLRKHEFIVAGTTFDKSASSKIIPAFFPPNCIASQLEFHYKFCRFNFGYNPYLKWDFFNTLGGNLTYMTPHVRRSSKWNNLEKIHAIVPYTRI
jgi:hypothetical protein